MTYNQGGYPPGGPSSPGGGQVPPNPGQSPLNPPYGGPPSQPGQQWGAPGPQYGRPGPQYGQPAGPQYSPSGQPPAQPQYGQQQFGGPGQYGGQPYAQQSPFGGPGTPGPGGPAPSGRQGGIGMILQFLIAGAGLFVILGAFLPWATATAKIGGSQINSTASGIDGSDGWITLFAALIAGGVAVAAALVPSTGVPLRLISGITATVAGLVIAGLAGYDLANVVKLTSTYSAFVDVSAGFGLYLTLLAGIAVLGLGIAALVSALTKR